MAGTTVMSAVIDSALAEYGRKLFRSKTTAEFQALQKDAKASPAPNGSG